MCIAPTQSRTAHAPSYLHGILGIGSFMHTALAHGVGAHPDVLLDLVAIGEVYAVPVQLLQRDGEQGQSPCAKALPPAHRCGTDNGSRRCMWGR